MNREAWWTTVHGVTPSWTQMKRLSTHAHPCTQESDISRVNPSHKQISGKEKESTNCNNGYKGNKHIRYEKEQGMLFQVALAEQFRKADISVEP